MVIIIRFFRSITRVIHEVSYAKDKSKSKLSCAHLDLKSPTQGIVNFVQLEDEIEEPLESDATQAEETSDAGFPQVKWLDPEFYHVESYELEEDDLLMHCTEDNPYPSDTNEVFTTYKTVAKKAKPVSGTFPEEARVHRTIPRDPLLSLKPLPTHPPQFNPTTCITQERMDDLKINEDGFLSSEEENLFKFIIREHERTLPYEEKDRGTLSQEYFSDYIMATVPHVPWEYKNIPIPPGIRDKVVELLKAKIAAGVYEPSQSSYRCRWFCVLKKNGTLRIIHDLQPLNKVSIRDAGQLPIIDDFVESFGGSQCFMVFDLFWGFDSTLR